MKTAAQTPNKIHRPAATPYNMDSFLTMCGLTQYKALFMEEGFRELEDLLEATNEELEATISDFGVKRGSRIRFRRILKELRTARDAPEDLRSPVSSVSSTSTVSISEQEISAIRDMSSLLNTLKSKRNEIENRQSVFTGRKDEIRRQIRHYFALYHQFLNEQEAKCTNQLDSFNPFGDDEKDVDILQILNLAIECVTLCRNKCETAISELADISQFSERRDVILDMTDMCSKYHKLARIGTSVPSVEFVAVHAPFEGKTDICRLEMDCVSTDNCFGHSKIIGRHLELANILQQYVINSLRGNLKTVSFELLYRATRDGDSARHFHQKCDNRGATVTIIRDEWGNVFGGFNALSWKSNENIQWMTCKSNFLFILKSAQGREAPVRFKAVEGWDKHVTNSPTHGPIFGSGTDLCIANNCTQGKFSGANPSGRAYRVDDARYFTNDVKFRVVDYEVFCLRGRTNA